MEGLRLEGGEDLIEGRVAVDTERAPEQGPATRAVVEDPGRGVRPLPEREGTLAQDAAGSGSRRPVAERTAEGAARVEPSEESRLGH